MISCQRMAPIGLAALSFATVAATLPSSPAATARLIDRQGPRAFLASLDDAQLDRLYARFQTGDAAWIALVPRLAPAADGANAEGLTIALAFALPKNPRAVLAATTPSDGPLSVRRVCALPFIEDTVPDRRAYRRRATAAVRAVDDPRTARARDRCVEALRTSR